MQAPPSPIAPAPQDPLAELHDILPPEVIPGPPEWIPWAIIGLLVLAGIAGFLLWKKRQPAKDAPLPDPRLVARKALQDLAGRLEVLAPKAFGIEISAISRQFIESVLQIESTRQTSEEFLADPRTRERLPSDARKQLDDFVKHCDALKYAEGHASTREMRALWDSASNLTSIPTPDPAASSPTTPQASQPPPVPTDPTAQEVKP